MSRINRGAGRREELRSEAAARAEERASRTPEGQLRVLDARLGEGQGAKRERARLEAEIGRRKTNKNPSGEAEEKKSKRSDRRKAKAKRNAEREAKARR